MSREFSGSLVLINVSRIGPSLVTVLEKLQEICQSLRSIPSSLWLLLPPPSWSHQVTDPPGSHSPHKSFLGCTSLAMEVTGSEWTSGDPTSIVRPIHPLPQRLDPPGQEGGLGVPWSELPSGPPHVLSIQKCHCALSLIILIQNDS